MHGEYVRINLRACNPVVNFMSTGLIKAVLCAGLCAYSNEWHVFEKNTREREKRSRKKKRESETERSRKRNPLYTRIKPISASWDAIVKTLLPIFVARLSYQSRHMIKKHSLEQDNETDSKVLITGTFHGIIVKMVNRLEAA